MENMSLHHDQLLPIFEWAWTAESSGDPEGRTKEVPDRIHCRDTALNIQNIFWWKIVCQKIHIHNASEALKACAIRNESNWAIINHYSNVVPIDDEKVHIDMTKKQLIHRWEISFGKKRVLSGSHEQILSFVESMVGQQWMSKYTLLYRNVLQQLALTLQCSEKELQEYLQSQKIYLRK